MHPHRPRPTQLRPQALQAENRHKLKLKCIVTSGFPIIDGSIVGMQKVPQRAEEVTVDLALLMH